MNTKDAYIKRLENRMNRLQKQTDNLTQTVLLLQKEKWNRPGKKTVRGPLEGQLSFFDDKNP